MTVAFDPLHFTQFYENNSDAQKAAIEKFFSSAPDRLKDATAFLGSKQYFGGASPSYGDFAFFHILDTIAHVKVSLAVSVSPAYCSCSHGRPVPLPPSPLGSSPAIRTLPVSRPSPPTHRPPPTAHRPPPTAHRAPPTGRVLERVPGAARVPRARQRSPPAGQVLCGAIQDPRQPRLHDQSELNVGFLFRWVVSFAV